MNESDPFLRGFLLQRERSGGHDENEGNPSDFKSDRAGEIYLNRRAADAVDFLMTRFFAYIASLASLAGCATFNSRPEASVSVTDLRPVEASLFETSAELTLRYTNESGEPLSLAGSAHRLYLNGSYVGNAVTNQALQIPALSTTTQVVIVHLENLALVRKLRELPNAQAIKYRLESTLHHSDGSGRGALKTASTGELDLSGLTHLAGP